MIGKQFRAKGATRGTLFNEVAKLRVDDAQILLEKRRFNGALYLAGYAIECLLKSAVVEKRRCVYLPADLETHNWDNLLRESGLKSALDKAPAVKALYSTLADCWGPQMRYSATTWKPSKAKELYNHFLQLYGWIMENVL
jgi:hypothetical protein